MHDIQAILAGPVVAVVSLLISVGFGIYAIVSGRSQGRQMALNLDKVAAIQSSLSTRYLGSFPDYLPHIVEIIRSAKDEVVIFCDFPSYGRVSNHHSWWDYRHAIESKLKEKIKVSLTCRNKQGRASDSPQQFATTLTTPAKWKQWKQGKAKTGVEDLLREHGNPDENVNDLEKERLFELLEAADVAALATTFKGARITETSDYIPVFIWLVDRRTAIFAFPVYSDRSVEQGFYTVDPRLISALEAMRQGYHERQNTSPVSQVRLLA